MAVISIDAALSGGATPDQIEAIAQWHDEKAERADKPRERDRHEVVSIRLWRLAQLMRARAGAVRKAA